MNESCRIYCSDHRKLAATSSSEMYMKESCHMDESSYTTESCYMSPPPIHGNRIESYSLTTCCCLFSKNIYHEWVMSLEYVMSHMNESCHV